MNFDVIERAESELANENKILAERVKYLEEHSKRVLKEEDICEMFGFNKGTLDKYKKEKKLPYHKFGRTSPVYFIKDEVEKWAAENFKVREWNGI